MTTKKNHWHRLLALISMALVVLGLGLFSPKTTDTAYASSTKTTTVKIGVDYGSLAYLQIIAKEKGYFTANGINAKLTNYASGVDILNGIVLGQVQIGAGYDYAATTRLAMKSNLRIVSKLATDTDTTHWFTVASSIKKVSQLKGKTIGVLKGTSEEYLWAKELASAGLTTKDVTIKQFSSKAETITALQQGSVDGIIGEQEYKKQISAISDVHTLNNQGDIDQNELAMVFSNSTFAKNHPKVLQAYLKALTQANNYIKTHKNEAAKISANYLNLKTADGKAAMAGYKYDISFSQADYKHLQTIANWTYKNKVITSPVTINKYLNLSALRNLDSGAVTYSK